MSDVSSTDRDITAAWRDHRPYLVNLAYQMLGDVGEAEDVAQEAFLRLSRADSAAIDDIRGWLTVVAGRLCLDQLRSARVRLETVLRPEHDFVAGHDPADRVTLDDEVHTALLEVLQRLTPGDRWRSCCTTCSPCRSTRSPRRLAGPRVRAANWPGAPTASRRCRACRRPT